MGAWTVRTERHVRRHVVMVLAAGFCVLVPAPGVAFAQSGGTAISAGYDHTCALEGGSAYCWGNNTRGALGDGITGSSDVPVAVDTSGVLAGVTLTQVTTGGFHTCALDNGGAAYCWGSDEWGELGVGSTSDDPQTAPVTVAFTVDG